MIEIQCDNCERPFEVDQGEAGGKVACPYCGDINRVPPGPAEEIPPRKVLPPEAGPEQEICLVHPAMFRAHPFRFLLLVALLIGGVVLAVMAASSERLDDWLSWLGVLMSLGAAVWWVSWFVTAHLWVGLRISNKRTIRHEGIIRRHTSEVLHDHVRNVEIKQSLLQRLFNVGYLGISSAGQDDIEIEVRDLPKPYEIKALIDEYRKM
ncbi:MAG: TFIIB-type zinc ribbon-containing protein [Planctomycetota bacterium]